MRNKTITVLFLAFTLFAGKTQNDFLSALCYTSNICSKKEVNSLSRVNESEVNEELKRIFGQSQSFEVNASTFQNLNLIFQNGEYPFISIDGTLSDPPVWHSPRRDELHGLWKCKSFYKHFAYEIEPRKEGHHFELNFFHLDWNKTPSYRLEALGDIDVQTEFQFFEEKRSKARYQTTSYFGAFSFPLKSESIADVLRMVGDVLIIETSILSKATKETQESLGIETPWEKERTSYLYSLCTQ